MSQPPNLIKPRDENPEQFTLNEESISFVQLWLGYIKKAAPKFIGLNRKIFEENPTKKKVMTTVVVLAKKAKELYNDLKFQIKMFKKFLVKQDREIVIKLLAEFKQLQLV